MVEFVWEYVIREVHESEEELRCSGTQRRLVSAADGGLFSDNIIAMEEKNRTSARCQWEGWFRNTHRGGKVIDYMSMSRHQK
jgi:hypothetical protein